MGNPKVKWTSDEKQALLAGVKKYGAGNWTNMLRDPELSPYLAQRSNIDLKDKWRNLHRVPFQGSSQNSKTPESTNNNGNTESSAPNSLVFHMASSMDDDLPNTPQDVHSFQWYNNMIFEAISVLGSVSMSDNNAISNFIEQTNEPPFPANFKRELASRLQSLVAQGKLEKVQNGYRIRPETQLGSPTKTPTLEQKEVMPQEPWKTSSPEPTPQEPQKINSQEPTPQEPQETNSPEPTPQEPQKTSSPEPTPQEAEAEADKVAKLVAEAEKLSVLADEALKEVESVSRIAEECDAMVELMNDIYAKCSEGEVIFFPGCQ